MRVSHGKPGSPSPLQGEGSGVRRVANRTLNQLVQLIVLQIAVKGAADNKTAMKIGEGVDDPQPAPAAEAGFLVVEFQVEHGSFGGAAVQEELGAAGREVVDAHGPELGARMQNYPAADVSATDQAFPVPFLRLMGGLQVGQERRRQSFLDIVRQKVEVLHGGSLVVRPQG